MSETLAMSGSTDQMPLPADLVYDPEGNPCCVVCRCYLKPWYMCLSSHVNGKRHAKEKARVSAHIVETRKILVMNGRLNARPDEESQHLEESGKFCRWTLTRAKETLVEDEMSSLEPLTNQFKNVMVFPHEEGSSLSTLKIDKEKFVSAVIAGEWKASVSDDSSSEPEDISDGTVLFAKNRANGFPPLQYVPKDRPDTFFESVPAESPHPHRAQKFEELFTCFRNKLRVSNDTVDDFDTPESIYLEQNMYDEEPDCDGEAPVISKGFENHYPFWLLCPEARDAVERSKDPMIALQYEIMEFVCFVSPTYHEKRYRDSAVSTTQMIVEELWPGSELMVLGSHATGLYLPSGDIDMTVLGAPINKGIRNEEQLAHAIRSVKGFACKLHVIKARVSIVRLVTRRGNVQVDISFNQTRGLEYLRRIQDYLQDFPHVRPLILVLKCFMEQKGLNSAFSGGICSYGLLLLVVSHLQHYKVNFPDSNTNLGSTLLNFFDFYGNLLNYCMVGMTLRDGGSYYKKIERFDTDPNEMLRFSVEDPNNPDNEVGRNGFKGTEVREAFSKAAKAISQWRQGNSAQPPTPLSTIIQWNEAMLVRRKKIAKDMSHEHYVDFSGYVRGAD